MKRIIILVIILLILTGCGDNKRCVKSHQEEDICVMYTYSYVGKTLIAIPIYYSCTKTVCDEYEYKAE